MNKNDNIFTVNKDELLSQIGLALNDYFVATLSEKKEGLQLSFPNGQTFMLSIQ